MSRNRSSASNFQVVMSSSTLQASSRARRRDIEMSMGTSASGIQKEQGIFDRLACSQTASSQARQEAAQEFSSRASLGRASLGRRCSGASRGQGMRETLLC
jgi:hypothetical protein